MRTNEQIELSKKLIKDMDELAFQLWLEQFETTYYTKEEQEVYERE